MQPCSASRSLAVGQLHLKTPERLSTHSPLHGDRQMTLIDSQTRYQTRRWAVPRPRRSSPRLRCHSSNWAVARRSGVASPRAVHPATTTRRGAWSPPRRSCDGTIAVPACPAANPAPPVAEKPCKRPKETTCRLCTGGRSRMRHRQQLASSRTTRACSQRSRRRAQGQRQPACRGSGRTAARGSASKPILLRR